MTKKRSVKRSIEEIKLIIEDARLAGCTSVEVENIRYTFDPINRPFIDRNPLIVPPKEVPELKPEEIVKPISMLDDLTEEEIQFWATPYFDELQAKKELQKQRIKDEV